MIKIEAHSIATNQIILTRYFPGWCDINECHKQVEDYIKAEGLNYSDEFGGFNDIRVEGWTITQEMSEVKLPTWDHNRHNSK